MPTPDVRVRLSAEGTAEVVAALKKVQAEGQKTSKAGGRSFTGFNSVLGGTTRLLAGLGVAVGVGAFVNFIRKSSEAADQIGKLGQKVGASVQNLSALKLAAETADVGTEQLAVGLTFLNRKVAELTEGSPKAQEAFRQLGLSAKDFKGKDAVQSFELVSQRIAKIGEGARKTAAAVDIFGRAGAQLIPLMNDLAEEGLTNLITRARELGVLFDEDMVAATEKLNDDFKLLELQSQALGAQFATGISPYLSQTLQILSGEVGKTSEAWRTMGEAAGWLLKILTALGGTLIDLINLLTVDMAVGFGRQIQGIIRALKGDLAGAREAFTGSADVFQERLDQIKNRWDVAFTLPPPPRPDQAVPPPTPATDPTELIRRQADATKSIRDAELAYLKAQLKARQDAEKRSFEEGTTSLEEYFAQRRRIIQEEADAEVASLLARKALLSSETDEIKAQAEAKVIDIQVNKIRLEQEGQIAALAYEETKAMRDLGAKALEIERQILEARGQRHEAAMLAIDEEMKKAEESFIAQRVGDTERTRLLQQLRASMTASADFEAAQSRAQAAMTDLGFERQRIDAKIRTGLITQMQGEQQLMALEQARLPILQQSADALMEAALATGSPEQIQQAREFALSIEEIAMATEGAADSLVWLRDGIEQSGIEALTDFFAEGIREGQRFDNAMAAMALSVVQSLRRMASEILATKIIMSLFSLFTPGGGGVGMGTEVRGGLPEAASGGLVRIDRYSSGGFLRGPGTGTSDSLVALTEGGRPVRLSNGEFVVRAAAVQQPGALGFLRDFNRWSMASLRSARTAPTPLRFAEGGMIAAGAGGGTPGLGGRLTVGLEEGLVLKALESSRGQKILVELVGRNRRTLQRVLDG